MEEPPGRRIDHRAGHRVRVAYFVPPSRHFAGIERVVHEIATGLAEAHNDVLDVHVVFAAHYREDMLNSTPYTLHVLGVDRLRRLALALRSWVTKHEVDVLVCPQVEASVIAWSATRGLGLAMFVTHLHGNPRVEESAGSRRTKAAFWMFRHVLASRIDGVLAVSPSLRDYAATALAADVPVYFAKNPVRQLGGERNLRIHVGDGFRLLNVGRLSRQKGQDVLLRALAIARPELPPTMLTLVGNGPEETALRDLTSRLGLEDMVSFAGYAHDPAEHFGKADCFVLSSRWEGFGVVLIEALQFGLPLLATDCDFGPADVITDSRIGDLVAPEDPEALAEGIRRAARRVGDSAVEEYRRTVARSYSRADAVEMHFQLLRRLVVDTGRAADGRLAALG
jgi:glycosyltransferase involved in cell wall biosynthesis